VPQRAADLISERLSAQIAGGGVGGANLMAIVGVIKQKMAK
jgi:hypothetical protein